MSRYETKIREITISVEYDTLYFEDLIYLLRSVIDTTKKFYGSDRIWTDGFAYNYLLQHDIVRDEEEYYKFLDTLKKIIQKSVKYQIVDFSRGSLKIRAAFVIAEGAVVPIAIEKSSLIGISIGIIAELAKLLYEKHEREFDEYLKKLRNRLRNRSIMKGKREKRKIWYDVLDNQ